MGAIELTTLPLDWDSDSPVWTPQWSLTKEKLAALTQLVNEQLQKSSYRTFIFPMEFSCFCNKKEIKKMVNVDRFKKC